MKRCGLGFLTPSYGFAYKRGKYIGVVTRNESVRMARSRTGRQRPQTLATAAPDGVSGLKGTEGRLGRVAGLCGDLGWTLRILGRFERGRLKVDDRGTREFLNV